ncbi:carotenoid biosynthesis protein [Metabacillus fastidiosus]|uniref:carotenoid biosynthesis protein n=1 Tax=Metabacillus fastidiosus TaxID=1458 RepID=UPI002E1B90AE|nr:carotenoid biosynthesis protein [Metabacillus fastidiosus]
MIKLDNFLFQLFIFWYICGVILLSFNLLPSWLEWANAFFLILAGTLASIFFIKRFNWKRGILINFIIFSLSFLIEFIGSSYNIIFGKYYYTNQFAPTLFNVPLAIGFAWLLVMGTSHVLAMKIFPKGGILYAVTGSFIAVTIDLIIDPVAYKLKEYWIWEEPGFYYNIPLSNFIGWFLVALLLHLLILFFIKIEKIPYSNSLWEKRMITLFILLVSMFVLLGFIGRLWIACIVTILLSCFILLLTLRGKTYD